MKPDWDTLGEKYEDSKKVLIGDVDCTGSGKKTCERFGVEGYPTLKCAAHAISGRLGPTLPA